MLGLTREVTKMQWNGGDRVISTEPLCDVIGTHAARRTFVVHALEEGMSPQIVISLVRYACWGKQGYLSKGLARVLSYLSLNQRV